LLLATNNKTNRPKNACGNILYFRIWFRDSHRQIKKIKISTIPTFNTLIIMEFGFETHTSLVI